MFELLRRIAGIVIPVFVVSTMLNVGLTQRVADIAEHLKAWRFMLKMLVANFVLAPLLMIGATTVLSFDPALEAGLLVFALCAGAPFLIKLTQTAEHDLALGAAMMMLLTVGSVVYVPLVLPLFLTGVTVDPWAIAKTLLLQMLLPIAVGMAAIQLLPRPAKRVQPLVGRVAALTLYVVLAATLVGYLPQMRGILGTGALFVAIAFILASFGIGYLMGWGKDHHEDIGGLGTAQRNTAAGLVIAAENFTDPNVLVILTLANTLGLVLLLLIASALRHDNEPGSPGTPAPTDGHI
jgi:BASS family bile acid:Na+ symporter